MNIRFIHVIVRLKGKCRNKGRECDSALEERIGALGLKQSYVANWTVCI